tara:strand:+ start:8602 stop:10326 length:1725 start_codon:yes stop_codon:yes gene_type:complete
MIVFETIRWKNFLSTGDQWTDINFTDSNATLIVGSNGAGKSTMLDALCFGLFNKPFRKINRGQLVNSINEKGLKVEVCFSIGRDDYRVFRTIKPNSFEVYKNNKLVDQEAAAKDTQKYLEQSVLKLNYKSFTQVVILGSSTFVPFMQLTAPHRREVIEDLLDIKIFSNMNLLLKDRVRNTFTQSKDCNHLLSIAEERVNSQEKLIKSLREVNSTRRKEKQAKIISNKAEIDTIESQRDTEEIALKTLEKDISGTGESKSLLSNLKQKQSDINSELKRVSKQMKFFKTHDNCPTCNQNITPKFKEKKISTYTTQGQELSKAFKDEQNAIDEVIETIEKADELSMKCHEMRSDISQMDRSINRLGKDNNQLETELIELQTNTPNIKKENDILKDLKEEFDKTSSECSKVNQTLDEFQIVSNLLKDSGIKKQIIKKYVPVFNNLINKYLHSMDFFVNFTLDEEFNEVLKSRFRDEFSYSSFSEGEKQKIDLALLFTWREVARMKNSAATNLLILDEVFDSSLDASATSELLAILGNIANGATNLFVISHKGDILLEKFKKVLRFEKINDFSKIVEDE